MNCNDIPIIRFLSLIVAAVNMVSIVFPGSFRRVPPAFRTMSLGAMRGDGVDEPMATGESNEGCFVNYDNLPR